MRRAVGNAMKLMGRQFVLGETIDGAMERARALEGKGYTYSYDMLGEAARTDADAQRYAGGLCGGDRGDRGAGDRRRARRARGSRSSCRRCIRATSGAHRAEVMDVLVPRARDLARAAARAGIGFNIDAEEAERLDLSLDVIEALLADRLLAGWDGFGVVVQAYGRRAGAVIDWLRDLARAARPADHGAAGQGRLLGQRGQAGAGDGAAGVPGLHPQGLDRRRAISPTRGKLLDARGRIYPQFATHNAHTVAAVLEMAGDTAGFEFQRLHGMGEALHEIVREREGTRCRIYAPVGAHRDLLAYLVRRLLENGANSSFVNQIVDKRAGARGDRGGSAGGGRGVRGGGGQSRHPAAGGAVRAAGERAPAGTSTSRRRSPG